MYQESIFQFAFKLFLPFLQRFGFGVELPFLGGKDGYVLFKVFLLDLALTVIFVLVNVPCLRTALFLQAFTEIAES